MTVRKERDIMSTSLNRILRDLDRVPQAAFEFWRDNTPKRTGNARRKTRLRNTTIEANYPYARVLDKGHSKQAPDGLVKPTEEFLDQHLKRILRK